MQAFDLNHWALILGGSSGFGLASAKKLHAHGMNVCVVHRDRRGGMTRIEESFAPMRREGAKFLSINTNALSVEGRETVLNQLVEVMGEKGKTRLVLHSIALGNLKPIAPLRKESSADVAIVKLSERLGVETSKVKDAVSSLLEEGIIPLHTLESPEFPNQLAAEEDMEQTIYNMGTSLLTWVQNIFKQKLFADDARVIGLTSEGNQVAWRGYAAVSAAKVALEAVSRSIAVEFAPYGIRSNILQPGVTPTPALKLIPGNLHMQAHAQMRNPFRRLTSPEDVANVVALLCTDEAKWINGTILRVDGGEQISS